jgi:hypothetical protein
MLKMKNKEQKPILRKNKIHEMNGLRFFRYSKLCMLQWITSVAVLIYGCILGNITMIVAGVVSWLVMPIFNEIVLNTIASVF